MNSNILRNIFLFILLILLQVLVFNNIQVFSYITPFIYVLFIILLPFETPRWLALVLGFFLGLFIDMFSNTGGIHAAATVLMAFAIPWAQNIVSSKQDLEGGSRPGIKTMGFNWFFIYALILTTLHHIFLFFLEVFNFSGFFRTFWHAMLNVIFTMFFIIISQYIFYKKK